MNGLIVREREINNIERIYSKHIPVAWAHLKHKSQFMCFFSGFIHFHSDIDTGMFCIDLFEP